MFPSSLLRYYLLINTRDPTNYTDMYTVYLTPCTLWQTYAKQFEKQNERHYSDSDGCDNARHKHMPIFPAVFCPDNKTGLYEVNMHILLFGHGSVYLCLLCRFYPRISTVT